jgi:hypothetical protein
MLNGRNKEAERGLTIIAAVAFLHQAATPVVTKGYARLSLGSGLLERSFIRRAAGKAIRHGVGVARSFGALTFATRLGGHAWPFHLNSRVIGFLRSSFPATNDLAHVGIGGDFIANRHVATAYRLGSPDLLIAGWGQAASITQTRRRVARPTRHQG